MSEIEDKQFELEKSGIELGQELTKEQEAKDGIGFYKDLKI